MVAFKIINEKWETVFKIKKGTKLEKGLRGNVLNRSLIEDASKISDKFGCYGWFSGSNCYYCGSFSQDYNNKYIHTNLEGRIRNYLCNHPMNKNGTPMTNLFVFSNINDLLLKHDVQLKIFRFNKLKLNENEMPFNQYMTNRHLVLSTEQVLISFYKNQNQAQWNRI